MQEHICLNVFNTLAVITLIFISIDVYKMNNRKWGENE